MKNIFAGDLNHVLFPCFLGKHLEPNQMFFPIHYFFKCFVRESKYELYISAGYPSFSA